MNERLEITVSYLQGWKGALDAWVEVGGEALNVIEQEAVMRRSDRVRAKAAALGYIPTPAQRKIILRTDPVIGNFIPESAIKNPTQSTIVRVIRLEYGRKEYDRLRKAQDSTLANLVKATTDYLSLAPQVLRVLAFGVEKK